MGDWQEFRVSPHLLLTEDQFGAVCDLILA